MAAAARAAVAKVDREQATAAKEAKAAAARAAAQEKAREEAEARAKAAAERSLLGKATRVGKSTGAPADASARGSAGQGGPAFAPGCSGTLSRIGACPSEAGAAGTTAAQVKQAAIGAGMVLTSVIPVGELIDAVVGLFDAGDAAADAADAGDAAAQADRSSCLGGSSFTAGTLVLLASGKAAPISGLKPGDKVVASDTRTGKDQPETVTAVLVHHDTDLYNLTVKTSHGTAVIHTTTGHLFWDPSLDCGWIPANHFKPGMHLKTLEGKSAVVVGGSVPAAHDGWMWDLTVPGNNDHDFYVVAVPGSGSKADVTIPAYG
jgi:hypothetical protein